MTPAASMPTPDPLLDHVARSGLRALQLAGRTLLPIVQGGMGVGVPAHRIAGSVAAMGAVGTISSVDLRRHRPAFVLALREHRVGHATAQRRHVALAVELWRVEDHQVRGIARGPRSPVHDFT
jgi:nitronate monooxygenase